MRSVDTPAAVRFTRSSTVNSWRFLGVSWLFALRGINVRLVRCGGNLCLPCASDELPRLRESESPPVGAESDGQSVCGWVSCGWQSAPCDDLPHRAVAAVEQPPFVAGYACVWIQPQPGVAGPFWANNPATRVDNR
jgi:hypothetical protein